MIIGNKKCRVEWFDICKGMWAHIEDRLKPYHVMQTPEWICAWKAAYSQARAGIYALIKNGSIMAVWPGIHFKLFRGIASHFISMPWSTYGGIITSCQLDNDDIKKFHWKLNEDRVARIQITLHPNSDLELHRLLLGKNVEIRNLKTHVLDIRIGIDQIWHNYAGRCRNQIKKAISNGIKVERSSSREALINYYRIYCEMMNMKSANIVPLAALESLCQTKELFQLWLAKYEEEILGGILILSYGDEAFYWAAATTIKGRRLYANNILLHKAIESAVQSGKKIFNFGASGEIAGVEHFKAGYGATERPYWQLKSFTQWNYLKFLSF